jgi:hypothetical protein
MSGKTKSTPGANKPRKAGAWLDAVPSLDSADKPKPLKRDQEPPMPPGFSFAFTEVPGDGEVLMAARIPVSARGTPCSIPPRLRDQLKLATKGAKELTSLVGLADYALSRLESLAPVVLTITPNPDGESVCHFTKLKAAGLKIVLEGALNPKKSEEHDPNQDIRRVVIPADVRQRIYGAMGGKTWGFSGVLVGLVQWALIDLKKRKKRLIVEAA